MIHWTDLARRLDDLRTHAAPGSLLTLLLPVPRLPADLPGNLPAANAADANEWFHWHQPMDDFRLTGLGCALRIETEGAGRFAALGAAMRGLREQWRVDAGAGNGTPPQAFCGFAFAPDGGAPLPNATLFVPAVLLRACGGRADIAFSCAVADADEALPRWQAALASLKVSRGGTPFATPPRLRRIPAPLADLAFLARGGAALSAIASRRFDKLVLTRSTRLSASRALEPAQVLAALAGRNPDCAVWAIHRDGRTFLGASPERLLSYRQGRAEVDALAGTAWTGRAHDGPHSLSLADDKNRREHELVADSVREALAPLCASVEVPAQPGIMRLRGLSHLHRRIVGHARTDVTAFDIIARLHPTPAVGGTPTASALDWLAAHGDRRGAWYTGGIGWLDADGNADFAVALRCGLIESREATLYTGAGFVAGSEPRQELAETEAKLSPMLAALRAGAARERATGT